MTQPKDTTTPMLIAIVSFAVGFMISNLTQGGLIYEMILKGFMIGLFSSLISYFLEFCYRPGNIFGFYMDFIEKKFRDNLKNPFGFLWKPLGGCIQCHNTWITFFVFAFANQMFGVSFWILIPTIVISHMSLSIFIKLLWE